MNYIEEIVREVERVYDELDKKALYFRIQSGLRCAANCSSCCTFKNIRASVLDIIEYTLACDIHPINISIQKAMDKVSFYFRGKPNPRKFRRIG